jgi:hypothetical protein
MATTDVRITQQGDAFVPDVSSVPIVAGDNIRFYADPDTQTNLCMKAETAAILFPRPELTVEIAAGDSIAFAFSETAAPPGNYCIVTQASDWPYPDNISCAFRGGAVLSIEPGSPPDYSGPVIDPQTLSGGGDEPGPPDL